jgi:hypothetical protein
VRPPERPPPLTTWVIMLKGKGLQLEFTVEDDGVFTKPWSAAISYRRPLGEWSEMVCAENPNGYFPGKNAALPTADKPDF